jgi:hypothetical protein
VRVERGKSGESGFEFLQRIEKHGYSLLFKLHNSPDCFDAL